MLFVSVASSDPARWNGSADENRTEMNADDSASTDVVDVIVAVPDEITFMT